MSLKRCWTKDKVNIFSNVSSLSMLVVFALISTIILDICYLSYVNTLHTYYVTFTCTFFIFLVTCNLIHNKTHFSHKMKRFNAKFICYLKSAWDCACVCVFVRTRFCLWACASVRVSSRTLDVVKSGH